MEMRQGRRRASSGRANSSRTFRRRSSTTLFDDIYTLTDQNAFVLPFSSKLPVSEIAKLAEGVRVGVQSFTPSQRAIPLGELSRVKDSPSQTAEVLETMLRRWISPHEDVPFHEIYYFQGLKDLIKVGVAHFSSLPTPGLMLLALPSRFSAPLLSKRFRRAYSLLRRTSASLRAIQQTRLPYPTRPSSSCATSSRAR